MKIFDREIAKKVALDLLKIKAVKLQPQQPFTWASGWKSPIYCDNRKTLSFPETRILIKESFAKLIRSCYPEAELIAGVATGAIAHGVLVADELGLPFVYIRSEAKSHGLTNLIEGEFKPGQKTVIIEDLISTGGSSLKALEAMRNSGVQVLGMAAIFTYMFPTAEQNFKSNLCELFTLSNYEILIDFAVSAGYISIENIATLNSWRQSPQSWGEI